MKNLLARVDKFMDDHNETIIALAIAVPATAYAIYFLNAKDVMNVRTIDAGAKIVDEKLYVKVFLNNGNWSTYTWDTLPIVK